MEDQNDYEAFFNSHNAPQESASWSDDLQAIVETESQNSKKIFFQLCIKQRIDIKVSGAMLCTSKSSRPSLHE
jgi:hypothetical protein